MIEKTLCPQCGEDSLDRVEVDIGVGTQCGPWQCYHCGWEYKDDFAALKDATHD